MNQRLRFLIALALLLCIGSTQAQAQGYAMSRTLDTLAGGNGLAVDNDGKIWYQSNNDSSGICVMLPSGIKASISPIFNVTVGGAAYNVGKGAAGMNICADGNILVSSGGALYKIDAKTGQGIARWAQAGIGRPAVDASGKIYVTKVVGTAPIWKLDQNLANPVVIESLYVWARSLEVTPDGKDLYAGSLWQHIVSRYHSDDVVTYKLTDTLLQSPPIMGDSPILKWDRKGRMWIGQESGAPYGDPLPMYAYDFTKKKIVDSIMTPTGDNMWSRPRALGFSPSGDTAYVFDFDTGFLQEWIKAVPATALVDDFEDKDSTNAFGGKWQKTDGMSGTLAFSIANTGYNSSYSIHITGKYTNWAGIEATLASDASAVDVSAYKGIRFAIKAVIVDTLRIKLREQKRVDDGSYEFAKFDFMPTSDWTVVTVPFASMVSIYSGGPLTPPFSAIDLTQIDFAPFKTNRDGDFYIDNIEFVSSLTSVGKTTVVNPSEYQLSQNYPNPFNPETEICYTIAKSGLVRLEVFTLLGQEVRTLVNDIQSAGTRTVRWNGRDDGGRLLPSGVYFYRLTTSLFSESKKMLLLR
jgi:hypothetical protein